jgi:CRISPR/Cas system CMR subunit Cmr4 (Cas7 group RAMP superfamily)
MIKAKEHDQFVQYFTAEYLPDESLILSLVVLIHQVAYDTAQTANVLSPLSQESRSVIGCRMVMSYCDVMQEYLQNNGNVTYKELRVFCKNKTLIAET